MEWRDTAIILNCRPHGETSVIVETFTRDHGRCLGLVRGGRSRQQRPVLQTGNIVEVTWRARIEQHLGTFAMEPVELKAGFYMEDRFRLAGLSTIAGLAQILPEREPHERLYDATRFVLDAMDDDNIWPTLLVRWELGLLEELGFGLDLEKCAASGSVENLCYISPRTGRAVSAEAGEPYKKQLFPLPPFLRGGLSPDALGVLEAFGITSHFLDRHLLGPRQIEFPQSRAWMIDVLRTRKIEAECLAV